MLSGLSGSQRSSVLRALAISAAFGCTSIATSFSFKAIFSVYKCDATFTLLGMQMLLTLCFCIFLRNNCRDSPGLEVPDAIDPKILRGFALPGFLFVGNIAVGFYGIKLVSIPMFLTVRRATTVFTLIAEYFMLGKVATLPVTFGVSLTVLGALVAGHESLSADWLGFTYTLLNNALTAASWSATKLASDQHKVTRFGLTFYNACIALPLCVLLSIANDEPRYLLHHPHIGNPMFLFALLGASCLGVLMNWVTFLAITMTSPLATSVTGNVKDIGGTFLGAMIFQDFVPTPAKVVGIIISFAGSAIFSWAKLAEVKSSSAVLPTTSNDSKTGGGGGGGEGIMSPRWAPTSLESTPRGGSGVGGSSENDVGENESSGSSLLRSGHAASRSRIAAVAQ